MNGVVRLYNNAIANRNMAYGNVEIYDRNKSEAEREQKLLIKLKRISARGNNAEVKQDRDGNWIVYEVKKIKAVV